MLGDSCVITGAGVGAGVGAAGDGAGIGAADTAGAIAKTVKIVGAFITTAILFGSE